jgi:hypothetical protein
VPLTMGSSRLISQATDIVFGVLKALGPFVKGLPTGTLKSVKCRGHAHDELPADMRPNSRESLESPL